MKIAFLADTPYQLLNAINIAAEFSEQSENRVDLFFQRDRMSDLDISSRLTNSGFFSNVYAYIPKSFSPVETFLKKIVYIVNHDKVFLDSLVYGRLEKIPRYDIVFLAHSTRFGLALRYGSKAKHVYFYEDGAGNYSSTEQMAIYTSWYKRLMYFCTGKRIKKMIPERIYVYRPDLCNTALTKNIRAIPLLSHREPTFLNKLEFIFGPPATSIYKGKKLIYLTSVNDSGSSCFEPCMMKTLQILKNFQPITIIRPHPRYIPQCLADFEIDHSKCLWELLCRESITEDTVLISECSTAQQNPKILFDKEPFLIYTLKLNDSLKNDCNYDGIIENITSIYGNKSKIKVPESWEEFSNILTNILQQDSTKE